MVRFQLYLIVLLSCSVLGLAGCQSDEEKAEQYYQSALALLEEGDIERALVELRNVFDYDGFHKEARMLYADKVLEQGRAQEAYSQYLRLIEQYPDTLEARVALTEMAIANDDWEEVERHGAAAVALSPDLPNVQAIDLHIGYRQAVVSSDVEKRDEIAAAAARVLEETRIADMPDNAGLVRIVIDNSLQRKEPKQTLMAVESALERAPLAEDLNLLKVRLLVETEDIEGVGTHLKRMVEMFPENTEIKQTLIQWYLSQDDVDGTEAFLRLQAGEDTADTGGHVTVIQLLQATKGPDAARAELERLRIANEGTENGRFYASMIAAMDFQIGDRDKAIADVRAAVDASDQGPQKTRLQVMLTQMLLDNGAEEDAGLLVDAILENDASNVAALRMRAARLIDEDKTGEAIVALRTALDQNPRDTDTLMLMAQAHARDGDTDLVGERLALAMEASDNAASEVLRYAQFLIGQDRLQVAATVLEDARRRTPSDVRLIKALANLHLRTGAWQQAQGIVQELIDIGTPESLRAATEFQATILQAQNRTDESLKLLQEQLADQTDGDIEEKIRSIVLIVQTQIRSGKTDAARATLDKALADAPDSTELRMLSASLHVASQEIDQAEMIYRDLMDEFPQSELPVRLLVTLLSGTDRLDDARSTLESALERLPDQPNLQWMQASFLEGIGDFEGAIAVYEKLHAADSNNLIVANNLASLITTHRDDPEDLARAANIARRLRNTEVPAFQDTFGWIAYRRGNFEEARKYLEPASEAMTENILVQYHLGMTYAALGRNADAKVQLSKALEVAGDTSLPQLDLARETLVGLD